MVRVFPGIGKWVAWNVGRGDGIKVGGDTWVVYSGNFILSRYLKEELQAQGFSKLAHVIIQGTPGDKVLARDYG